MVTKTARPTTSSTDVFVANESGVVHVNGQDLPFRKGVTRVHRGHPIYKAVPNFFEPLTVHYSIVTTTATPGEQRGE